MGVNSLPKTVTRQRRDCDLNPGLTAPESSTLSTRLPSHNKTGSNSKWVYVLLLLGMYREDKMSLFQSKRVYFQISLSWGCAPSPDPTPIIFRK